MGSHVIDLPPFAVSEDRAGSVAAVVASVLRALGRETDEVAIKAISGEGFRFVYDAARIFEPLRDLAPIDFVREAFEIYGVRGRWMTGHTLDELDPILEASIQAGWPVITSRLDASHDGYQVIVGIEPGDVPQLAVQAGVLDDDPDGGARPRSIALDADWDGPVSGRARWAKNPVFVIEAVDKDYTALDSGAQLAAAGRAAQRVDEVFEVEYADTTLVDNYTEVALAGRCAPQGADAWATLLDEMKAQSPLAESGMIWRVEVLGRRLQRDRQMLQDFFARFADDATATRLVESLGHVVEATGTLRELLWNRASVEIGDGEEFAKLLSATRSLAYPIGSVAVAEDLAERGYDDRLGRTGWGPAIFMEDDVRWLEARQSVRKLSGLDADVIGLTGRLDRH